MYFSDFKLEAVNTVKRFSNFGFPYVIAPAFSLLHFPLPHFERPPPQPTLINCLGLAWHCLINVIVVDISLHKIMYV